MGVTLKLPEKSAEKLLSAYKRNNSELVKYLDPLVILDIHRFQSVKFSSLRNEYVQLEGEKMDNILIIDDKKEHIEEIKKNLILAGFSKDNIIEAYNPNQAVSIIFEKNSEKSHENIGIVLLDWLLREGNRAREEHLGLDVIQRLSTSRKVIMPEIILMTEFPKLIPVGLIDRYGIRIAAILEKEYPDFNNIMRMVKLLLKKESVDKSEYQIVFGEKLIDRVMNTIKAIQKHRDLSGYYSPDQLDRLSILIKSYFLTIQMKKIWNKDELIEFSVYLIEGICQLFRLPERLVDTTKKFLDAEEILYTIPKYRDHFIHQLKVFLIGFCILNEIYLNHEDLGELNDNKIMEKNAIKLWFIIAMFHDIGYPIEKIQQWLDVFFTGLFYSPKDIDAQILIPKMFKWDEIFTKGYHYYHFNSHLLESIRTFHELEPEQSISSSNLFYQFVTKNPEHGVISSMILMNLLDDAVSEEEIKTISHAIAFHSLQVSREFNKIFRRLVTFKKTPFAFLLMYCDIVQDWGRVLTDEQKQLVRKFGESELFNENNFFENGTITTKILYKEDIDPNEWKEQIFKGFINPLIGVWMTGMKSLRFNIEYYYQNNRKEVVPMLPLSFC